MGLIRVDGRRRGDRERPRDAPVGDRLEAGVDRAELGQERRGTARGVWRAGRAPGPPGRGGWRWRSPRLAQVGVLLGQAAEVDLQGAEVGHGGQGQGGLEPRLGRLGRGEQAGDRLAVFQGGRGRDRAVPDLDVGIGQQPANRPGHLAPGPSRDGPLAIATRASHGGGPHGRAPDSSASRAAASRPQRP